MITKSDVVWAVAGAVVFLFLASNAKASEPRGKSSQAVGVGVGVGQGGAGGSVGNVSGGTSSAVSTTGATATTGGTTIGGDSNSSRALGLGSGSPSANACAGVFAFGFSYRMDTCARQQWYSLLAKPPSPAQSWLICQDDLIMDAPFCKGFRPAMANPTTGR